MKKLVSLVGALALCVAFSADSFSHGPPYSKHNDDLFVVVEVDPPVVGVAPGIGGIADADIYIYNNTDDVTFDLPSVYGHLIFSDGSTSPLDFGSGSVGPDGAFLLFATLLVPDTASKGGARVEIDVEYVGDDGSSGVTHAFDAFTVIVRDVASN